jgi:hypothetical protein
MLDLGSQSFDTFSLDWYSEEPPVGLWVFHPGRTWSG